MEEEKKKWLESLKVGSYVGIEEKFSQKSFKKVERLSDKMIFLEGNRRFWKEDGRVVGSATWNWAHLVIPTIEFVNEIRLNNIKKYLESLWNKTAIIDLGIDKIQKIIEIIESKPHDSASQSANAESLISVKRESADSPNSPHDSSTIKEEANFS